VSEAGISRSGDGRYAISGDLTFTTVPDILRSGYGDLGSNGQVRVDLAGITRVDSAGIALLIDLARTVRKRGGDLSLLHAPPQLMAIAGVSGLEAVLPFADQGKSTEKLGA
jgi:phospholipid transport system transporter-binding protein